MKARIFSKALLLTTLVRKKGAIWAPLKEAKYFGLALVSMNSTMAGMGNMRAFLCVVLTEPQPALKFLSFSSEGLISVSLTSQL